MSNRPSPLPPGLRPSSTDDERAVRYAAAMQLYGVARRAATINIILGLTVAFAGWNVVPPAFLLAWLGTLILVNLSRTYCSRHLRALPEWSHTAPLHRVLIGLTLASGATWSTGAILVLAGTNDSDLQYLALIAVAGLAAGSIPVLAMETRLYLGYLTTLVVPVAGWLLLAAPSEYMTIGVMLAVFFAAMVSAGLGYAGAFQRSHRFAHQLALAKERTERTNVRLQQQFDEALRMQEALGKSEHRFHTAFDQAPIGMALINTDSRLIQVNPMLAELLAYDIDDLVDRRIAALVLDEDLVGFEHTLYGLMVGREQRTQVEIRFSRADGQTLWASVAMAVTHDTRDERYIIIQVQDITDSVELSARLQYEASHDHLTGFNNRREFERHLMHLLASHRPDNVRHTLCYLDLDRFKTINDSEGHVAGDEILRQVAAILEHHLRGGDTIARIGGDEFAILLEYCDVDAACRICETLVNAVNEFRFCWRDAVFRLDLSVGIAAITPDQHDPYDMLRLADAACAAAKEAGGARVHVYRAQDEEIKRRQGEIQWISLINDALDQDAFQLFGQPIVPTVSSTADTGIRFEVLIRMPNSEVSELLPSAFLPAAERYGLAARLDRWVIDTVFAWFRRHPEAARRVDNCAINLSGASLGDAEFTEHVMNQIRGAPLSPAQLRFEVTETAAIGRLAQARHFMRLVQGLGCHFALDDFGSGLSSFGYLRSLPVDTLKIDGQFVRDIVADDVDRALVKSINDIGRVLGLSTIAECVEDVATLDILREIAVDYVQGYFVGHPVPIAELFEADQPETAEPAR